MDLYPDPPLPPFRRTPLPEGVNALVLFVSVNVKDVAEQGRLFQWNKPRFCPKCHSKLWWHGFVLAYFACCPEPVLLRRLRCSKCRAVHRLRPAGYFRRFRSSVREISQSIKHRNEHHRWDPGLPRSRQRQWWRRLGRMVIAFLGCTCSYSAPKAFARLMALNIIPVTAARKSENITAR